MQSVAPQDDSELSESFSGEASPILPTSKPKQSERPQICTMKRDLAFLMLASFSMGCIFIWSSTRINNSKRWASHLVRPELDETKCNQQTSNRKAARATANAIATNSTTNLTPSNAQDRRQPKVLCFVLTVNTVANEEKSSAVRETWGKRCDKLLFVERGSRLAEINGILRVDIGKESRQELWHKVVKAATYVYEKYLNDYDWFMKADDDTYLIVERLKQFLRRNSSPERPIYFGYKFKPYVHQGYMSGGSGYVMSRQALKLLVEEGFKLKRTECHLSEGAVEDVEMGSCLESVGVEAGDSRDAQGRPTFLPLAPDDLIYSNEVDKNFWYYSYAFFGPPKGGKDCCSDEPISFHYIDPKAMRFIDWLLYDVKQIYNK